ncbi:hypothetical protein KAT51_08475 [bacterium]|nr:hypothetical protein [bacterium]
MGNDIFYRMKNGNPKEIKTILKWANKNGLKTMVTMLEAHKSWSRTKSDKDFDTVVGLINESAAEYFVIIIRKQMNLFGILTDEKVIKDMLEIGIRGIDVDSKEYFICIYLEKDYIHRLKGRYELDCLNS